jgi:hypothetical protein
MSVHTALTDILDEAFFADVWRQRPVVIPGVAEQLFGSVPTRADFDEWLAWRAEDGGPVRVKTDGRTVTFAEQVLPPVLVPIVDALRQLFRWGEVCCDAISTNGSSTLGAHYDNSDNFSLLLQGEKEWKVARPETLAEEERRRRLLDVPGATGRADGVAWDFELSAGPGDLIYLPTMFPHWGLSRGDSLSITMAVHTVSRLELARRAVDDALQHDPRWWQPFDPHDTRADEALLDDLARAITAGQVSSGVRSVRLEAAPRQSEG